MNAHHTPSSPTLDFVAVRPTPSLGVAIKRPRPKMPRVEFPPRTDLIQGAIFFVIWAMRRVRGEIASEFRKGAGIFFNADIGVP